MKIDIIRILTTEEIAAVLADVNQRAKWLHLTIFRLSCCCGLRRSEISGVCIDDFELVGPRPHIKVSRDIAKGRVQRRVPLWWDSGTLSDLKDWYDSRLIQTEGETDHPFICSARKGFKGAPLSGDKIAKHWDRTISRVLGWQRAKQLSIHCGRHSFVTHSLHGGRSLAEVRDAAGHSNVATTNAYLHAIDSDVPDIFQQWEDDE